MQSIRFVLTFFGSFLVSRQKMNVKSHCTLLFAVVVYLSEINTYKFVYGINSIAPISGKGNLLFSFISKGTLLAMLTLPLSINGDVSNKV